MSINSNFNIASSGLIVGGGGMDEEYKRIIERMLALGLTPTGNKTSDKAKLREIEMQLIKTELGQNGKGSVNSGKYVTISTSEIEKLKEKLQEKAMQDEQENKELKEHFKNMTGAEQQALLNKWKVFKAIGH